MTGEGLARLTEKEREALRLVPTHGTITAIATELGVSDSAVKLRFASATKKLGVVGRHDAARLLMKDEGWAPYPKRTVPNGQVEPQSDPVASDPHQTPGDGLAMVEDGSGEEPSIGHLLTQIADRLADKGGRNRLTPWQRIACIFAVMILGLLLFSMLMATMTEMGRYGRGLRTAERTSI
jgi:DNA-binding CsgD family transcriptional regulator